MKTNPQKFLMILVLATCITFISSPRTFSADCNEEKSQLLESIGVFSSSNLFLVYVSLSLINENIVNEFQLDGYEEILKSIENINQLNEDNLKVIKKDVTLSENDLEFIIKIERACVLLKEDATLLKRYLNTNSESDYKLFFAKHSEASKYLEELFNNK